VKLPASFGSGLHVALIAVWNAVYFYCAFLAPEPSFGFDQWRHLGSPALGAVAFLVPVSVVLLPGDYWERLRRLLSPATGILEGWKARLALAVLCGGLFLLLRNGFVNGDGAGFVRTFGQGRSCFIYDEMWTSFLTFRAWRLLTGLTGMSVQGFYALWSSFFGAVFVFVLASTARILTAGRRLPFVLLVMSGGFMQLFFGDLEDYAAVNSILLAFYASAALYLRGRWTLLAPAVLLALAASFHLLSGWLLPAALFLGWTALKRRRAGELAAATILGLFVIVSTVVYMDSQGYYMIQFLNSHSLEQTVNFLHVTPDRAYWGQVFNLLFLLFPAWGLLGLLAITGRIGTGPVDRLLSISTLSLLSMAVLWHAGLGPYCDWNLYAAAAVPASLLCWRSLLDAGVPRGRRIALAAGFTSALHSACWIVSNHFFEMSWGGF